MGRKSMRKSFDDKWEEIHASQEQGKYPPEHVIRFVARNFYSKDRKSVNILDFGCGAGANTWYLCREKFNVYAFDGSKSAVNKVNAMLEREGLKANVSVADGMQLDYSDNYFDAIIDNVSIYCNYYENINAMYEKCYKLLKNDGLLYTVCFGKKTDGYKTGNEIEKDTYQNMTCGHLMDRGMCHFFDVESLRDTLCECGFNSFDMNTILYTDLGSTVELITAACGKK